jgi:hypothetical protein
MWQSCGKAARNPSFRINYALQTKTSQADHMLPQTVLL